MRDNVTSFADLICRAGVVFVFFEVEGARVLLYVCFEAEGANAILCVCFEVEGVEVLLCVYFETKGAGVQHQGLCFNVCRLSASTCLVSFALLAGLLVSSYFGTNIKVFWMWQEATLCHSGVAFVSFEVEGAGVLLCVCFEAEEARV